MTADDDRKRRFSRVDCVIALITLVVGVGVVIAADLDQRRVEPPAPESLNRRNVPRPEWVWHLVSPYRRLQHDYTFALIVATLGVGAIMATDRTTRTRRGISRPGTLAVFVAVAAGAFQILSLIVARWPSFNVAASFWYDIRNNLDFRVAGAILGAWVAVVCSGQWRPASDWKEKVGRIIGWGWFGTMGMLLGYGLLFG